MMPFGNNPKVAFRYRDSHHQGLHHPGLVPRHPSHEPGQLLPPRLQLLPRSLAIEAVLRGYALVGFGGGGVFAQAAKC